MGAASYVTLRVYRYKPSLERAAVDPAIVWELGLAEMVRVRAPSLPRSHWAAPRKKCSCTDDDACASA